MNILWSRFWFILLAQISIFELTIAENVAPANKCCNNDINLLVKSACVPDSSGKKLKIALKCEAKYVLDPTVYEDDSYNVTKNGSLHVQDFQSPIPADEFCLVHQQDEDDSKEVHEVAIVCFPETDSELSLSKLTFTVKAVLIFTSVLFLILTLYIYFRLAELRETQDKVTIVTLINLTIFLFFLGILQVEAPFDIVARNCVEMAFIVYFFTMGYFAWLNCVIANVFKTVVLRQWKIQELYWYILNHIYGWSVPFVMTINVGYRHHIIPRLGVGQCWFHHDDDQKMLVYLPISIMLALNVILCIWTSVSLIINDFTPDTRKALRYKSILYLKLFLLGGFTWFFEVLSFKFKDHAASAWVWVIVDTFNCLHGILTFFVLIVWRQRIRKELAGKRILCYLCPSKWADVEDDEQICLENEGKGKYDLIVKTLK